MALIDGEYYYRPPAKKTAARKALYYPAPAPKRQQPVVDQYLQNRGYGTIPATQQQYTPPPPAPAKKPPIKIYEDDAVNYGLPGWTMPGLSPTGAPPPGVRQPITKPTYFTRPPNSPSTLRSTAPSKRLAPIYEESATNYGLPGWTKPGMSPTGAPPPGTREPVSLAGLWKGGGYSNNPNYNVPIYEEQATNYGLPGYTIPGMSPTGAPPPGTILPTSNYAWEAFDWLWHGNNPMRPAFNYSNRYDTMNSMPASPWASANMPTTGRPPSNVPTRRMPSDWRMAPTSFAEANALPGVYRPAAKPFNLWDKDWAIPMERTGMPWVVQDATSNKEANARFPFRNQERYDQSVIAMGLMPNHSSINPYNLDPWASDPYDPAGIPYGSIDFNQTTGEGGGGGGGGWGYGGGGGAMSYGASSGVSSYLPGAGGGYGARASSPNYTGRGSGRGGSYAGGQYQNQAQWRMPMLVWNI